MASKREVKKVGIKEAHDVLVAWSTSGLAGEEYYGFLKNMGLKVPGNHSYLYEITNQKLWFLAKIKYGI